jgi:hypothetical protein
MRWTRRNHLKVKALALSLATSAVVAGPASAMVHDGGSLVTPTFAPITSVAQQYGGTAELPAAQQAEISYLSWGATAENTLPFQSTRDSGPVFMNGLPDGYVGSGITQDGVTPTNLARAYVPKAQQAEISYLSWGKALETEAVGGGVTPTNLARAYVPLVQGVSSPDGYQPQLRGTEQLVIRDKPDGFQPQTKNADVVSVSAGSGLDSSDLALGFGLGLILATAAAIALAMVRDRQRIAHS